MAFFEAELPLGLQKGEEILEHPVAISNLFRLSSIDALGHDRRVPFRTPGVIPAAESALSWSADDSKVAFVGQPLGEAGNERARRVYIANGDGSGLRGVPGTGGTSTAVLASDG